MGLLKIYQNESNEIKELNLSKKTYFKSIISGALFAIVIMAIPVILVVNFLLSVDYLPLLITIIYVLVALTVYIGSIFTYQALEGYEEKLQNIKKKTMIFFDATIINLILGIVTLILILIYL